MSAETETPSKLNIAQQIQREAYEHWTDYEIKSVTLIPGHVPGEDDEDQTERPSGFEIVTTDHTGFIAAASYFDDMDDPQPGDEIRLYGQFGRPMVGLDVNKVPVWFKTQKELDFDFAKMVLEFERKNARHYEERRAEYKAKYDALPSQFQIRIDRLRAVDPSFVFDGLPYELFILVEANKIAVGLENSPERIKAWRNKPYAEQKEELPDLDYEAHSGNTHGAAGHYALALATDSVLPQEVDA